MKTQKNFSHNTESAWKSETDSFINVHSSRLDFRILKNSYCFHTFRAIQERSPLEYCKIILHSIKKHLASFHFVSINSKSHCALVSVCQRTSSTRFFSFIVFPKNIKIFASCLYVVPLMKCEMKDKNTGRVKSEKNSCVGFCFTRRQRHWENEYSNNIF